MTTPPEPEEENPNWAFPASMGIKCPECGTAVTGLDWVMGPPPDDPDTQNRDRFVNQGMDLRPCHHQLTTPPWQLTPSDKRGGVLELRRT